MLFALPAMKLFLPLLLLLVVVVLLLILMLSSMLSINHRIAVTFNFAFLDIWLCADVGITTSRMYSSLEAPC